MAAASCRGAWGSFSLALVPVDPAHGLGWAWDLRVEDGAVRLVSGEGNA